jgi:nucleotide-binding universal stress UspA family protein
MKSLNICLSPAQRQDILTKVSVAMRSVDGERRAGADAQEPVVLDQVKKHLDCLATIVRRSSADQLEPYLAQIHEDICSRCSHQEVSGYCSLRSHGECPLFRNARPIIEAIARVLNEPPASEQRHSVPKVGSDPSTQKENVMYHRILIAVDRGQPAEYAAKVGMDLARKLRADVALLTVLPSTSAIIPNVEAAEADAEDRRRAASQLLARCRGHLPGDVKVDDMVFEGRPADEILSAARTWHADLVVVGTHNRHGLSRFLLGSTAEAVVRHAPCPVLVARQPDEDTAARHESATSAYSGM